MQGKCQPPRLARVLRESRRIKHEKKSQMKKWLALHGDD